MPKRTSILISPAGDFCSGATDDLWTSAELRACAREKTSGFEDVWVKVDGKRVRGIGRFHVVTRRFFVDLPVDNLFGVDPQTTPVAVGGTFVIIKPLSCGYHTIVAHVGDPINATIRYSIHVVRPV